MTVLQTIFAYTKDNPRPRESVNITIIILKYCGMWFPEEEIWTWKSKLYVVYAIIMQGFWFYFYMVSETLAMLKSFSGGDIVDITESLFLLLTHYAMAYKCVQFYRYQKRMITFLNNLETEILTPKNAEQKKILRNGMRRASHDSAILLSAAAATCLMWAIFPFIEFKEGDLYYKLPLSGWYPWDTRTGWKFIITFIYQIIGVTMDAFVNISMDTTATGIFIHLYCQIDMLKESLVNMKRNALESLYKKKVGNNVGITKIGEGKLLFQHEELEEEMKNTYIKCVKHHYAILTYAEEIENIFNMCFLAQFFAGVIIVCMTMFAATLLPSYVSIRFFSMMCYQFCIVFELLLYSWHGNELILKSLEIGEAAYNSEWYEFSHEFSKDIILIMIRSRRPIEVTAGKFFALSLSTFMGVLRLSWSYFAVLRSVNE